MILATWAIFVLKQRGGLDPKGVSPPDWVTLAGCGSCWLPTVGRLRGCMWSGSQVPTRKGLSTALSSCAGKALTNPSQGMCLPMVDTGRLWAVDTKREILDEKPGMQPELPDGQALVISWETCTPNPAPPTHNDTLQLMPFLLVSHPASKTMLDSWL